MKWINPTDATTGSGTDSNSVDGTCTWGGAAPGRQQECNQARLHPKPWPQNSATSNAPLSPLCTLQGFHSSSSVGKLCTHWITFAAEDYVRACLCTAWPPPAALRGAHCLRKGTPFCARSDNVDIFVTMIIGVVLTTFSFGLVEKVHL